MKLQTIKTLALGLLLAASVQTSFAFRVVGYFPSWQGSVSGIQFSKVTHVNYAFLLPNSNGSLQTIDNASKLQSLVTAAHNAGVKVSISVGGWNNGDDSAFVSIAGNSSYRTTFVNNLVNFVNQYDLDGVDIDWEYPDTSSESSNYTTLMGQLASAMHSRGKLLTAAVIAYGSTGDYISTTVFGDVDWLNIMDYDNTDGVGQSTYSSAITAVNYWVGRGLSKSKTELGVPFYSDPSDYAFWDLLNRGANPNSDTWGNEGYNGIPTIQSKTKYAVTNGIGGMMIWELSEDATGTDSLLSAMYSTIQQYSGGGGSLPSGWTDADIGSVGLGGSAGYSSGTFTISGAGADIWNTADGFNYAYQSASGDTTVIARVVSENGSQTYAKAGVMIRESSSSGSVEASVLLTPSHGVAMEIRKTTGASSINVAGWITGVTPPQWVKIVRSGNTFTTYYSANGSTWTQIASTNVTMASSTIVGLAVTSHDTSSLNTASFDNVSVGGSSGGGIDTSAKYQIENEASGLVLNNQGSLTNGSKITQWSSVSSDNLRWTFIPTSNGYYQINSVKSGLDAVVQSASTSPGAGIIQWSFGSSGDDQWQPVANSDGSYTFYNLHSGLVLEDPGSSMSNTTQMDQWGYNGGANQKWTLIKQ